MKINRFKSGLVGLRIADNRRRNTDFVSRCLPSIKEDKAGVKNA